MNQEHAEGDAMWKAKGVEVSGPNGEYFLVCKVGGGGRQRGWGMVQGILVKRTFNR